MLLEGLIQVGITGIVGLFIVKWFESPKGFEKTIDPIYNMVIKRYDYVVQRNRMLTMNGHP